MKTTLKWGILGTGSIAEKFAKELPASRTGQLVAVGSRTAAASAKFTAQFPATAHASYEALLADPAVEAVYISTPHPMHAEWAIRCAEAGKHVLCEKPMTMNLAEAQAVIEAARRHDVFLMEAFMYRCHPQTAKLVELIRAGAIGEVRLIHATFSFRSDPAHRPRLFEKHLGGGAILDVGCYPASMSRLIAGAATGRPFEDPAEVKACAELNAETGVDESSIASLKFPSGIVAQIGAGLRLDVEKTLRIWGTEGSILVPSPWHAGHGQHFSKILLFKNGVPEEVLVKTDRGLFALEADHVAEHLAARQSPAMSWDDTLGNLRTLDRWRESVGLRYEADAAKE